MDNDGIQTYAAGAPAPDGYIYGADLLVEVDGDCVGHCSSHEMQYKTDTKQVAVKAPKSDTALFGAGFKELVPTGQSITLSADGIQHYKEMEASADKLREAWYNKKPVTIRAFRRDMQDDPYLVCKFIITDFTETAGADGEATYKISATNHGAPSVFKVSV